MDSNFKEYPYEFDFIELLAISWNILTKNYYNVFKVSFISYLTYNIILYIIPNIDYQDLYTFHIRSSGMLGFYLVLIFLLTSMSNMPMIVFTKNVIFNDGIDTKLIFIKLFIIIKKEFTINILTVLTFSICLYIYISIALIEPIFFILTFIPVFVIMVFLSFSVIAFIVKDINLWKSINYSYQIVRGRWLKVFLYMVIMYALSILTTIVVSLPYSFFMNNFISEIIFNTIVNIFTSYFVILSTVLFINFDDTKLDEQQYTRT
jgi:hypothetical protein